MGEISNQCSTHKINNAILKTNLRRYDSYFHSSSNKRGVAMFVKKSLEFVPISMFKDLDENLLLIKFAKEGVSFVLGSVYGPNQTDRTFFNNLSNFLMENRGCPVVLAGDWNTTWDNSPPPPNNIDIANMARTPNAANGNLLKELANRFELIDPFRVLFPGKICFSYSPFGTQRKNRSRLDFFLVSSRIMSSILDSGIFSAPLSSMFDHKPVFLTFTNVGTEKSNTGNKKK
jgi:exonuclease III